MSLLNYIIRRLLLMIVVLFGVSLFVFSIMMIIPPGQRAAIYVTQEKITPAQMNAMIKKYGLDDPAPVQYARWLKQIFSGNFGYSVTASAPVIKGFATYFPITLELVLYSTPLIILVGIWLGTLGAVHKDTAIDHGTRVFAIIGYSLPTFWLGLILLMIFYGYFGIFPPGYLSNKGKDIFFSPHFKRYTYIITIDAILNWRWNIFWDALYHLALPAINLVLLSSALILRLMRSSMLESLGQDYIRTALAKGADKHTIYNVHARRNAMIPVITISGLLFAGLLGGMVITETIFAREGIGLWMARAALQLDISAIMFNVLFLGTVFVFMNLIVDIVYAYIDPRIRLS
ncbi:MAG: ABC transporter permease [Spirochaetes bacterium]|nr:MAG: ABC transporter permease [Spirochaetota bacterium]